MINGQYQQLESIFDDHIDVNFIMKNYRILGELTFGDDSCHIKRYLSKHLRKSGSTAIMEKNIPELSPRHYASLEKCQSTSISVERSFSMLKKINAKDRNFKQGNLEDYLICKFNAHIL